MYSSTTQINIIPSGSSLTTINPHDPASLSMFVNVLAELLNELRHNYSQLIILCIGSDRSTGDSLGPLVGSMLEELQPGNAVVMGTLTKPVHALNLAKTRLSIKEHYDSAAILAVDAGLGQRDKIGTLEIGKGSLKPGAAVKKRIPPIGDIYITGIVNIGGFMELMVLQTTSLGIVFHLARFIGWGIYLALAMNNWLPPNKADKRVTGTASHLLKQCKA
jgi:putative sporulation protein YyaC